MKTINQIAKAALTRFLKPETRIGAFEEFYRTVSFSDEELGIETPVEKLKSSQHYGNLQFNSGVCYKAWGIELGFEHLNVEEGKNVLDSLAKLRAIPSHIITYRWSNGDMGGEHEDYTVYRLKQNQENSISKKRIELKKSELRVLELNS